VLRDSVHAARVRRVLDAVRATCDVGARREADPVSFVHGFTARADQELAALLAACLAFGNAKIITKKLAEIRARLGPDLTLASRSLRLLDNKLEGFVHRVFRASDVARLLFGARRCQERFGSLEATFVAGLPARPVPEDTWEALASFVDALRHEGRLPRHSPDGRRGPAHLLPDVRAGAGAKRLFLFLRWMVRPADGVDLGLWSLPPGLLFCPVDTHILKLGRNLGLTSRADGGARTVREITASLASFDPLDPIKYDFSLCHLGMATRCRERHDPPVCGGCPAREACRHVGPGGKATRSFGFPKQKAAPGLSPPKKHRPPRMPAKSQPQSMDFRSRNVRA